MDDGHGQALQDELHIANVSEIPIHLIVSVKSLYANDIMILLYY